MASSLYDYMQKRGCMLSELIKRGAVQEFSALYGGKPVLTLIIQPNNEVKMKEIKRLNEFEQKERIRVRNVVFGYRTSIAPDRRIMGIALSNLSDCLTNRGFEILQKENYGADNKGIIVLYRDEPILYITIDINGEVTTKSAADLSEEEIKERDRARSAIQSYKKAILALKLTTNLIPMGIFQK